MDEVGVFHVFCQTLQEAQGLIEDHWHCNLGELLNIGSEIKNNVFNMKPSVVLN